MRRWQTMTWPFENDTSAIVKKLAGRSMQADKRNKAFLLFDNRHPLSVWFFRFS